MDVERCNKCGSPLEWIPCELTMPEPDSYVLIAGPGEESLLWAGGNAGNLVYAMAQLVDGKWFADVDWIDGEDWEREPITHVTHWMPLPEPPMPTTEEK